MEIRLTGNSVRIFEVKIPRISTVRLAQIAIGVLILIVIRSLAELLVVSNNLTNRFNPNTSVYVVGALIAAVAALASHVLHAFGRDRFSLVLTGITIGILLVMKIIYSANT